MTDRVTSGLDRSGAAPSRCAVPVLVLEHDPDVRDLLEAMLDHDGRFEVVGWAADTHAALQIADQAAPQAAVVDLDSSGEASMSTVERLHARLPEARIVVLSSLPDPYTLVDALRRGADAYIDKTRAWAELLPVLAGLCRLA